MIPDEFVTRFLWASDSLHAPEFDLTPGLLAELNASLAFAFRDVEKALTNSTKPFLDLPLDQKCVVLSCSQTQGTHIIDAAVRHAAREQGADVLVLDAVELACGRFGALGPEGAVIDKLYSVGGGDGEYVESRKFRRSNQKTSLHDSILPFLDALLFSRGSVVTPPTQRRIIYIRDFQFFDEVSKPLLTYILLSLYRTSARNYPPEPYVPTRPIPLLVFGTTKKDVPIVDKLAYIFKDLPSLSSLFTFAHASVALLNKALGGFTCWDRSVHHPKVEWFENFFDIDLGMKVDRLMEGAVRMTLFASNVGAGAVEGGWQKDVREMVFRRLNRALFRVCLERNMQLVEEYPDIEVPLHLMPGTTILDVRDGTRVAGITMGLAASQEPSQQFEVYISKAFEMYKRSEQERLHYEGKADQARDTFQLRERGDPEVKSIPVADSSPMDATLIDLSQQAQSLKGCIVDTESIPTTFDDVIVDPATIESIQTIISLPLLYPSHFNSGILAKEAIGGILLYGPPGTGKTMLCRALAKSSHANMLQIRPNDINDKYIGESEKRVAAVFELAYRLAPCIIFIDEIDALFSSRNDETKTWERNILTEFMQCMDGLRSAKKNRDRHIVVVGATNRPYDLDHAILRRMPRKILVDLPGPQMRKGILTSYLRDELLDANVSIDELAIHTKGFSGSDLRNLCVAAALASLKDTIGPQWKQRASDPQTKRNLRADFKDENESEIEDLPTRKITVANFRQARLEIPLSTSGLPGNRLDNWHWAQSAGGRGRC